MAQFCMLLCPVRKWTEDLIEVYPLHHDSAIVSVLPRVLYVGGD